MVDTIGADEAMQQAIQALLDGPGDPRSVEGAKVNALQSIAWSLIGILAKDTTMAVDEAISDVVTRAGLVAEIRP